MRIHAFVVCHRRFKLQKACIDSVLAALGGQDRLTVLVNGPQPEFSLWLTETKDSRLNILEVPEESRTRGRNRAFLLTREDILYFLDDDVEVPSDLFTSARAEFSGDPELAVLGGPNLTPPGSTRTQRAFGSVMASAFAAPMVRCRYSLQRRSTGGLAMERLILCNIAIRTSLFTQDLRFHESLTSSEENLFLSIARNRGLKITYTPEIAVFHHRRKSVAEFCSQIFSYGRGRGEQIRISPTSTHALYWVPLVVSLFSLLSLMLWGKIKGYELLIPTYFSLAAIAAFLSREIRTEGVKNFLACVLLTPIVHGAYAMGFVRGLFSRPIGFLTRPRHSPSVRFQ